MVAVSDDVIGVGAGRAAALAGISLSRLAAWERIGLILPEAEQRPARRPIVRLYGLDQLVELRVAAELVRRGVGIEIVRRLVEAHRNRVRNPLRELRWATDNGKVYVGYDDGSWVGGRHPMQGVMPEVINLDEIRSSIRRDLKQRGAEDAGVSVRRGKRELFAGTRTPVEAVTAFVRRGVSDEEILEAFPHLTAADIALARTSISA
jgi:DNA-binding transcriptional MerR regulator